MKILGNIGKVLRLVGLPIILLFLIVFGLAALFTLEGPLEGLDMLCSAGELLTDLFGIGSESTPKGSGKDMS